MPRKAVNTVEGRLETFTDCWPFPDDHPHLSARAMAEAGFYRHEALNKGDLVFCYRCFLSLYRWEDEDDPAKLHALYAPKCGSDVNSYDVCGIYDMEVIAGSSSNDVETGAKEKRINYEEYVDEGRRLQSFPNNLLNIKPDADIKSTVFRTFIYANSNALAMNGFFCRNEELVKSSDTITDLDSLIVCYACGFNLTYTQMIAQRDIFKIAHEKMRPNCWHHITHSGVPDF